MSDTLKTLASIKSFEELKKHFTLEQVVSALKAKEQNRTYHKTQYLKRQAILAKAKEMGITG
jgi:hypothetical protein